MAKITQTVAGWYDTPPKPAPVRTPGQATACGGVRLPRKSTLDYTIAFITAGLLVLSLPWLIKTAATNPAALARKMGAKT